MGPQPRIHITGASGTGVSTLGGVLAERLGVPQLDTDDFYWAPTDPPFTTKRSVPERLAAIAAAQGQGGWILSGSLDGWGDPAIEAADLVVFLHAPMSLRLARLKSREMRRFGDRIGVGGDMEAGHMSFIEWAASYDDPQSALGGRSRVRHEVWLRQLAVPVLRLSGTRKPEALADEVLAELG